MPIDFRLLVKDSVLNVVHPAYAIDAVTHVTKFPSRYSLVPDINTADGLLSAIEAQEEKVLATMVPTKR